MALVTLRQNTPKHRIYVYGAWGLAALAILFVIFAHNLPWAPFSLDQAFRISQINDVVAYAVAILGLNLVIGYSGQLSLGQSAFVGLGAYTTIILVADHGWSYFATIPVSVGLCFVVGLDRRPTGTAHQRVVPGHRHPRLRLRVPDPRAQVRVAHRRPQRQEAGPRLWRAQPAVVGPVRRRRAHRRRRCGSTASSW